MSCLTVLQDKGLKLTPQRRLIVEIIHEARSHLAAEDIIRLVMKKMAGVHKSTIYRTLDILEETGCIYKTRSGDQFIYHHAEEGHHHHLLCRGCGTTIECQENIFYPLEGSLAQQYGFKADFRHIVLSGLCRDCEKKPGR